MKISLGYLSIMGLILAILSAKADAVKSEKAKRLAVAFSPARL